MFIMVEASTLIIDGEKYWPNPRQLTLRCDLGVWLHHLRKLLILLSRNLSKRYHLSLGV